MHQNPIAGQGRILIFDLLFQGQALINDVTALTHERGQVASWYASEPF